jgi:hypothetical protein
LRNEHSTQSGAPSARNLYRSRKKKITSSFRSDIDFAPKGAQNSIGAAVL